MKKALVLFAATIAATASMAQTNQVLSRNAVGYEKFDIATGTLALVRADFNDLSGANLTVTNLLGSQLPQGTTVFIWDRNAAIYKSESRGRSGWNPGTNVISRGAGFWIQLPAVAPSNNYSVYMMGEVPDSVTAPTTTIANITGFDLLGLAYPVATTWTGTTLAAGAPSGANLFIWDQNAQTYASYSRGRSGWNTPANFTIQPGQGFWFQTTATQTWSQVKPYTWP